MSIFENDEYFDNVFYVDYDEDDSSDLPSIEESREFFENLSDELWE